MIGYWISIKDRLPEHGQLILGGAFYEHPHTSGTWIETWNKDEPLGRMTHWRPLSEPKLPPLPVSDFYTLSRDELKSIQREAFNAGCVYGKVEHAQAAKVATHHPAPDADNDRRNAEAAYALTAFDFESAPIGSRDWTLFYAGWRAALVAQPCAQTVALGDVRLPRHQFWGAGEPDCPKDLFAPNGELHTIRCKVCGDGWRNSNNVCLAALAAKPPAQKSQPEPDYDNPQVSACSRCKGEGCEKCEGTGQKITYPATHEFFVVQPPAQNAASKPSDHAEN